MKIRITKRDREEAVILLQSITPISGEKRAVEKCHGCGQLFGRRYIPFGMGHGLVVNPCLCQLTAHVFSSTVLETTP